MSRQDSSLIGVASRTFADPSSWPAALTILDPSGLNDAEVSPNAAYFRPVLYILPKRPTFTFSPVVVSAFDDRRRIAAATVDWRHQENGDITEIARSECESAYAGRYQPGRYNRRGRIALQTAVGVNRTSNFRPWSDGDLRSGSACRAGWAHRRERGTAHGHQRDGQPGGQEPGSPFHSPPLSGRRSACPNGQRIRSFARELGIAIGPASRAAIGLSYSLLLRKLQ